MTGGSIIFVKPLKKTYKKASIPSYIKLAGKKFYVTEIGSDAFDGCSMLKTVFADYQEPIDISQNSFYGISARLIVAPGTKDKYLSIP